MGRGCNIERLLGLRRLACLSPLCLQGELITSPHNYSHNRAGKRNLLPFSWRQGLFLIRPIRLNLVFQRWAGGSRFELWKHSTVLPQTHTRTHCIVCVCKYCIALQTLAVGVALSLSLAPKGICALNGVFLFFSLWDNTQNSQWEPNTTRQSDACQTRDGRL